LKNYYIGLTDEPYLPVCEISSAYTLDGYIEDAGDGADERTEGTTDDSSLNSEDKHIMDVLCGTPNIFQH
jgi:hypothetical protein